MEITALIKALEYLKFVTCGAKTFTIYSDSKYLINGIMKWSDKWRRNGWKTSSGTDVLNRDLWEQALQLIQDTQYRFTGMEYVEAHKENYYNNLADKLANQGCKLFRNEVGKV